SLTSSYVADSDPLEEDPKEDPADYLADEREDEEENEDSSEDDEEEEEEASEDDDEEEHLAPADSTLPAIDSTRLRRAQIFVRPHTPPSPSVEARIAEYAAAPTPPSPPPSPLSPLSSLLPQIPSPPLPSPPLFEVGESSTAAAARKTGHTLASRVDYEFIDTLDASIRAFEGRVMTAIEEVNKKVIDLAATQRQDVHELYVHHGDAQDDRDALRAQISLLTRERRYFRSMASSYERDAVYARQAWAYSEDRI
ncbi:hypothetical protein Tco_1009432, partial [Tanacetum coccineum]